MVPVALSSVEATLGLVVVFFVVFPVLVQGLIAFAIAQVIGERSENQEYQARRQVQRR
jgi:phage shock protein PspC (stress-responsive transcriptional regulator)